MQCQQNNLFGGGGYAVKDKLLFMAGLARRARKLSAGSFTCEKMIKSGRAKLIIIAEDASKNTKKQFTDACRYYNVPIIEYSDMETIGKTVGVEARAVISVNDKNFAEAISDIYSKIVQGM